VSGDARVDDTLAPALPRVAADAAGPDPDRAAATPSVYAFADLYDLLFEDFTFDLPFWTRVAREAGGPTLELGCGTGRVLLALRRAGADVDGVDLNGPMLDRLRDKARAAGMAPTLVQADMTSFSTPRRYARVLCPFNGFAHADGTEAQIATLVRCREHLLPGGAVVLHMSYPSLAYWSEPDGVPVREQTVRRPGTDHTLELWDLRFRDRVAQRQRSEMEIRELDASGATIATTRVHAFQRWVYRAELELLFRTAGFARWRIDGGFEGEPLERDDQQMIAWGWR
jgi:SAM-dependent methyltransferase